MRALEIFYITGKPMSVVQREKASSPFCEALQFGVSWDRSDLYKRINARTEIMFKEGLVEEVESLRQRGYHPGLNSLNTVGYKEVFEMLDGRESRERTLELIRQNTRRFAKRQLTWFNADHRIQWLRPPERNWVNRLTQRIARSIGRKPG